MRCQPASDWPLGEGEMVRFVREHDWAGTALGAMSLWSERRRMAVELVLANSQVSALAVGPERVLVYNDAAARHYRSRHPSVLGLPLAQAFPDSYPGVVGLYDRAFAGETVEVSARPVAVSEAGGEVWEALLIPVRDAQGRVDAVQMTGTEVGDRLRTEEALRDREERLREFGEASSDVLWIRDAETLAWEYLSPAFEQVYGLDRDAAKGGDPLRDWLDLVVPEDRDRACKAIQHVRGGGRATFEYRIRRPLDGQIRLLRNTDFPICDPAGRVIGIGGVCHDATEEQIRGERLKMLVAELQHRTRNLMGVVRSVTDKTISNSTSLEDFRGRIRDRLVALTRVNSLLSRLPDGDRIDFDELLRTELMGHGVLVGGEAGQQVGLHGPPGIRLRSSTVQILALGLHELATNALKHGALSRPEGRLDIHWHLARDPQGRPCLRVEWRESGVHRVGPEDASRPPRRGYGLELIERALPYQLKAETTYELTPEGVRCTIILPVIAGADHPDPGRGGTAYDV